MSLSSNHIFDAILPTKINFYLRCMGELGFHPTDVLEGTGLHECDLREDYSLIEIPAYIRIVSNMMKLTGDPELAFKLGEEVRPGDLGVLGCAFSASKNAAAGSEIWQRYSRLFFGNLIAVKQVNKGQLLSFEFIPQIELLPLLLQFFVEEKINIEMALYRRFNHCMVRHRYFGVTYPRPAHGHRYNELLELDVEFESATISYGINPGDKDYQEPFDSANTETLKICQHYLESVYNVARSHTTFSAKVQRVLTENLPHVLTLPELAQHFKISERTFCRNLAIEQTSYNLVLSKVRTDLAKNYIATTTMTSDEIAARLGFVETGSFRKAFKKWTGKSIKHYRTS